ELIVHLTPGVKFGVYADNLRIKQILNNLVSNAIKFTEEGEVVLKLSIENANYMFCIQDSGIGLPEDALESIFEKFTQADMSTTRRFGGTGLGLAISRELTLLMGGSIKAENICGGAQFTVSLPLQARQLKEEEPAHAVDLEGSRILVVDDNDCNLLVLGEHLRNRGCQITTVDRPCKALEALATAHKKETPFDAAVIDFQMPEMSGMDLAGCIRQQQEYSGLRMLLLSSVNSGLISDDIRQRGFDAYLLKPTNISHLNLALSLALSPAKNPDELITKGTITQRRKYIDWSTADGQEDKAKILVVEDNVVNQMVARASLERLNCHVFIASCGQDALDNLERQSFDLVFMDMQMPDMSGPEVTRLIRASDNQQWKNLPIVAMTANVGKKDRQLCDDSGMNDFIGKPFTPEQLKQCINQWIGKMDVN
ncbi:MAG: response regulator, partial [Pseudomonadales bacterium]|nr:response regulator [Pseudomonadales bacterium]